MDTRNTCGTRPRRMHRRCANSASIVGHKTFDMLIPFVVAICLSLLSACSPVVSTDDLRFADNDNNYEFQINEQYLETYQTILKMARECNEKLVWNLYPIPDRVVVDGKMNKLRATGYVSVELHPGIIGNAATIALVIVDVSAVDEKQTRVVVYSQPSWNHVADAVQAWVLHDSQECVPK